MPKIGKKGFFIGRHNFDFETYYSSKDGFYYKGLDQAIVTTVKSVDGSDAYENSFRTESELEKGTRQLLIRYFEIVQTEKKIILVRLSFGTALCMNRDGLRGYSGHNPRVGRMPDKWEVERNEFDYSFGFEYSVGVVVEGKERKFFEIRLHENGLEERAEYGDTMSNHKENIELDYTPERLEFFKSMESGMEKMAKKIVEFFADEKKMLQLIDSNQKLLS